MYEHLIVLIYLQGLIVSTWSKHAKF